MGFPTSLWWTVYISVKPQRVHTKKQVYSFANKTVLEVLLSKSLLHDGFLRENFEWKSCRYFMCLRNDLQMVDGECLSPSPQILTRDHPRLTRATWTTKEGNYNIKTCRQLYCWMHLIKMHFAHKSLVIQTPTWAYSFSITDRCLANNLQH